MNDFFLITANVRRRWLLAVVVASALGTVGCAAPSGDDALSEGDDVSDAELTEDELDEDGNQTLEARVGSVSRDSKAGSTGGRGTPRVGTVTRSNGTRSSGGVGSITRTVHDTGSSSRGRTVHGTSGDSGGRTVRFGGTTRR